MINVGSSAEAGAVAAESEKIMPQAKSADLNAGDFISGRLLILAAERKKATFSIEKNCCHRKRGVTSYKKIPYSFRVAHIIGLVEGCTP